MAEWTTNWEEVRSIGGGGQGITKLVRRRSDGLQGVLKLLRRDDQLEARSRMNREVASLRYLSDVGADVPSVLEENIDAYKSSSEQLFLVMEYIDGPTLATAVRDKKLGINEAIDLTLLQGRTVSTAHRQGILHRDIKPDNILLEHGTTPHLVDFGLSFNDEELDVTETAENFKNKFLALPETNTPGGDRRDSRSDTTALAAILLYCMTGYGPGHLNDGQNLPPHLRKDCPFRAQFEADSRFYQLSQLLTKALSVDLALRFQQVDYLISELQELRGRPEYEEFEDPTSVETRLRTLFEQKHAKTRVSNAAPRATKFRKEMNHGFGKVVAAFSKDSPVKVEFTNIGTPPELSNPDVGEWLNIGLECRVWVHHHEIIGVRRYHCALRENHMVLATQNMKFARDNLTEYLPVEFGKWLQDDYGDTLNAVVIDFKKWISAKMQECIKDVFGEK